MFDVDVATEKQADMCSPIYTTTPSAPGKMYLKAALFDTISSPKLAVFKERQPQWATLTGAEGEI
ncbi:uncharacterized protein LDX57_007500 [Aspergillus melleus]|uniref:uncharacterized protein n=1 Tax=Aspergillus melleus TaxID=138277 RepID=UPI001E8EAC78|nr:uncharacterized protein LDX57_007500 [Aspergillus melleus]KAH8429829.1 hypothetical protein LDX57_007500 [Aspergillus melleus]